MRCNACLCVFQTEQQKFFNELQTGFTRGKTIYIVMDLYVRCSSVTVHVPAVGPVSNHPHAELHRVCRYNKTLDDYCADRVAAGDPLKVCGSACAAPLA